MIRFLFASVPGVAKNLTSNPEEERVRITDRDPSPGMPEINPLKLIIIKPSSVSILLKSLKLPTVKMCEGIDSPVNTSKAMRSYFLLTVRI